MQRNLVLRRHSCRRSTREPLQTILHRSQRLWIRELFNWTLDDRENDSWSDTSRFRLVVQTRRGLGPKLLTRCRVN
ncbi:hypothetical protein TNCV_2759461 [Trichonephila clavipes]|nr:hypothetical protein TNCV_2759461 [Trichonephila clavipes]